MSRSSSDDKGNTRFSGLETDGMKSLSCSLLFPLDYMMDLVLTELPPGRLTVHYDPGFHNRDAVVNFPGSGVCNFVLMQKRTEQDQRSKSFPHHVTVAGKCLYTKLDRKEFAIMMRGRKQGKKQGLGANSELDWPDVKSLEICPKCAKQQTVGKTYWLVYYPLLQVVNSGAAPVIGTRMHNQLVCIGCFEDILKDQTISMAGMNGQQNVPILQVLEQMPAMPLFHKEGFNRNATRLMGAYALNMKWEETGTLKALQTHVQGAMSEMLQSDMDSRNSGTTVRREDPLADANATDCLVCKKEGTNTCSRCKKAVYCSRECQRADWKRHKLTDCIPREEKKKEPLEAGRVQFNVSPVCPSCGLQDIDKGFMVFCFMCGSILKCHLCAVKDGHNVLTGPVVCGSSICRRNIDHTTAPKLQALLKHKPTGPHVNLCRLMLAQCQLCDDQEVTGCQQNIKAAKREYLRLANEEEFGFAIYAIASMCNPEEKQPWTGPLNYLEPPHPNAIPFAKDPDRARRHYLKAASKDCPTAMNDVGLMYKNGSVLFPLNKQKALDLFRKAAKEGDPRAMCNAGKMLITDNEVSDAKEGLMWYRKAAQDYKWRTAQLMLVQIGVNLDLIGPVETREYAKELKESGFLESEHCALTCGPGAGASILEMIKGLGV